MKFITFEGCDFSGKSTQIKLIKKFLEEIGKKTYVTREPGGSPLAEKIRSLILNSDEIDDPAIEYLLIAAARTHHCNNVIIPKLKNGYYVISDRFYDSSVCYQGYYKGLSIDIIEKIKDMTIGCLKPYITFLIDISIDNILYRKNSLRSGNNTYDYKNKEFYIRIKNSYLKIAKSYPERIIVINGDNKIDEIHYQIKQIFLQKVL